MEQEAAKILRARSEELFGFRYVEMLSDGDSSSFKAVTDLAPYGPNVKIEKLECINHVDKRMGKVLRKLSEEKRLGGKGRGKLTKAKCKH